jgi:hypothetical protein
MRSEVEAARSWDVAPAVGWPVQGAPIPSLGRPEKGNVKPYGRDVGLAVSGRDIMVFWTGIPRVSMGRPSGGGGTPASGSREYYGVESERRRLNRGKDD